jgi:uncharacterized protein YkwD
MRSVAALTLALASMLAVPCVAPVAASGKARLDGTERAIVRAVNRQRSAHGLGALDAGRRLSRAADHHSWEMLAGDYFSHASRDGGPFERRVRRYGDYRAVGETLAWVSRCGHRGARRVVSMWMGSSGHRAILLSSRFRRIGVGKRTGKLGSGRACVVTADFASRR